MCWTPRRLSILALSLLVSRALYAQSNTTFGTAATLAVGHTALSRVGVGSTEFWFRFVTIPGRSYCAESAQQDGVSGFTDAIADTVLNVFDVDGTTLLASNDDADAEPLALNYSRACWIASRLPVGITGVRLTPFNLSLPVAQPVQIRVVDTTLFCPWFFIAGDYNAFSLIRNTSFGPVNPVVVTWRGLNGAVAGTTTVSIPPNGGVILNARDFVNPASFSNGTIEIAYPGPLDQLQGSTTTLSGTTGLGFDAQFTQRRTW